MFLILRFIIMRHIIDITQGLWAFQVNKGWADDSATDFVRVQMAFLFVILFFPITRFLMGVFSFSWSSLLFGNIGLFFLLDMIIGLFIRKYISLDYQVLTGVELNRKITRGSIFFYIVMLYWISTTIIFVN